MKKRIVITMVTGLIIASLAGCGTQADATDQEVPENSAVESGAETEDSATDESTSTEVIGDDTEEQVTSGDLEDDNIILYAEKRGDYAHDDYSYADYEYSSYNGVIHAETVIPLLDEYGYNVGEMKIGGTVYVTEVNMAELTARFKNPIEGTEYEYLYTGVDYVESNNLSELTTTELEDMIKESLGNRDYDAPVFTEPTDDMELLEFRIPMYYDPETDTPIYQVYEYFDRSDAQIFSYKTYSVICTEDTDDYIICQVYYKDLITDEEFNNYGH